MAAWINKLPATRDCARVEATANGDEITLAGFSGNKANLRAAIDKRPGPASLTINDSTVQELPWPQCEVKENYEVPAIWHRNGLQLQVDGLADNLHASAGSALKIRLNAAKAPGYLYVFYIQAQRARNVIPLHQPLFDKGGRPLAAVQEGTLDLNDPAPGLHRDLVVSAPYGPEVILAIQTRAPLFKRPLAAGDWNERTLLTRLRSSIAQQQKSGGILGTDAVYLTTQE